jgi:hypothetical protein
VVINDVVVRSRMGNPPDDPTRGRCREAGARSSAPISQQRK